VVRYGGGDARKHPFEEFTFTQFSDEREAYYVVCLSNNQYTNMLTAIDSSLHTQLSTYKHTITSDMSRGRGYRGGDLGYLALQRGRGRGLARGRGWGLRGRGQYQHESFISPSTNNQCHAALFIPEIQDYILEHLEKADQVVVCRLSKVFSDSALNAIYKKVNGLAGVFGILGEMDIEDEGEGSDWNGIVTPRTIRVRPSICSSFSSG